MRIVICDDSVEISQELEGYIKKYTPDAEIFSYSSGDELLGNENSADIVFLDIELGSENGIDVAYELRKKYPNIIIIFVSSHREYVFEAFRCEALHFIVKPVDEDEFDEVFKRALHKFRLINSYFKAQYKQSVSNIQISDILYVEVSSRRLLIHTLKRNYDHSGKLYRAYDELSPHGFIYAHQGCIVNLQHVESFDSESIALRSGEKIMLSVRKRTEALREFNKYISNCKW